MALVSAIFYLLPTEQPPRKKVTKLNRHFTILDRPSSETKPFNQLRKPFQWYRDHWYRPNKEWKSINLPVWMKDYFAWHQNASQNPSPSQRYLVLQCLQQDRQCGGLADRLLSLPFLVLIAAQSQRILVIVWTVPFPLEEFLMPNAVNWMMPIVGARDELSHQAVLSAPSIIDKTVFTRVQTVVAAANEASVPVVRVRLQDYVSSWEYYDHYQSEQHTSSTSIATQHYRELFQAMFVPSPPLAQVMEEHHLISKKDDISETYAVAHYRALYGPQTQPPSVLQFAAKNAVHCASSLLPGKQVAFLSDSLEAISIVQRAFGSDIWIRHPNLSRPILHLDKATRENTDRAYVASDFFDTFLDLFIMAGAQCISYGQGGFARMGSLLSKNRSCANRHFEGGRIIRCVAESDGDEASSMRAH